MYALCDNILVQEPSTIGDDGKEKLGKIVLIPKLMGGKLTEILLSKPQGITRKQRLLV
jgi:hypothetical protein